MANTELFTRPRNIGEIFFSGSQSVKKGQAVSWILSDTWAFKTTEPCGVSTNASPFVQLDQGETFIIYKRTQADIDAGNYKGIYIFDRDTVVALAYPQEVTQDIIIENDIYNNNLSTIIVESDKTPVAKIVMSSTSITLGESVTISGSTSYSPDTPQGEIVRYEWIINGVNVSNAETFVYTPTEIGQSDILLLIEDDSGRLGDTSTTLRVEEKPAIPAVTYTDTSQYIGNIPESTWTDIFTIIAQESAVNANCILDYSAGFGATWTSSDGKHHPQSAQIRLTINGTVVYSGIVNAPATSYQSPWLKVDTAQFTRTINKNDTIKLQVQWTDTNQYASLYSVCSNGCINGELQIVATPQ